ncbi:hypothetical protein [Klebsiella aerogenes]
MWGGSLRLIFRDPHTHLQYVVVLFFRDRPHHTGKLHLIANDRRGA